MNKNSRNKKMNNRINNNSQKASHKLNLNNPKEVIINFYHNNNAHNIKNKTHNLKEESLN